ncbi:MAG TPA: hypothetical protein PLN21_11055 [Gemmatales bacterium]|nr:hypothetical protein [Gemmatales bacterium]
MQSLVLKSVFYSAKLDLLLIILVLTSLAWFGLRQSHSSYSLVVLLGELQSNGADESEVLAQLGNPPPPSDEFAMDNLLAENEHGHSWYFCEEKYDSLQFTTITAVFNTDNKLIQFRTINQLLQGESIWNYRWHRLLRRLRIE